MGTADKHVLESEMPAMLKLRADLIANQNKPIAETVLKGLARQQYLYCQMFENPASEVVDEDEIIKVEDTSKHPSLPGTMVSDAEEQ